MIGLTFLSYACWTGAILAILAYGYVLLKLRRGLNGLGLVFTAMALAEFPMVMRYGAVGPAFMNAVLTAVCMVGAATTQVIMAVRGRTPWDGSNRREGRE